MENIGWFTEFVTSYGVQQEYGFVTVDLFEKQNVSQVSNNFCTELILLRFCLKY